MTGKSGDGGIDGRGILSINPLLTIKVLFQCKRYKDPVGSSKIRDFQAAVQGRADKGIFLCTSSFTQDARKGASRDGAIQIELIDVEKIVDLLENLEMGLKKVEIFTVDPKFFDPYK